MTEKNWQPATKCARAGVDVDGSEGAVIAPLYLSSTFTFAGFDQPRRFDYSRSSNPTRQLLAEALAELEGGTTAVVTASGLGAITTVLHALLAPGGRLLAPHDGYGGSWRLFRALADKGLFELVVTDLSQPGSVDVVREVRPTLLWVESPSNPLLRLSDIAALSAAAHEVGALVAVDNTFATPLGQQPLALGADVVVHSSTKFINGHSDVISGVAIAANVAVGESLAWWANTLGVTGAAFDSHLVLRGLRTLAVRYRQQVENALEIAEFLAGHEAVSAVYYPGLAGFTQLELAARLATPGSLVSFELASPSAVPAFLERLRVFTLAESLGGVESLICHPATMTHAAMSSEALAAAGIKPSLLRLSVGIESVDDLRADLAGSLGG